MTAGGMSYAPYASKCFAIMERGARLSAINVKTYTVGTVFTIVKNAQTQVVASVQSMYADIDISKTISMTEHI